jgi:hypothetical protein
VAGAEAIEQLSIGDGVGGRPAVVGQDPLDPDPELGELGRGNLERVGRRGPGFIGHRDHDRLSAGIVDDHLEMLIASAGSMAWPGLGSTS